MEGVNGGEPAKEGLGNIPTEKLVEELLERIKAGGIPDKEGTLSGQLTIAKKNLPKQGAIDKSPVVVPEEDKVVSKESEGKKWADILRREGGAFLSGKFATKSWAFFDHEGNRVMLNPDSIGVAGSMSTGFIGRNIAWEVLPMRKYDPAGSDIKFDRKRYAENGECNNRLIITDCADASGKKDGWVAFNYLMFNTNTPDVRLNPNPIGFIFVLPSNRAGELISIIKNGNVDIVEHMFQNTYPGFIGTSENQAQRIIAQGVKILNLLTDSNIKDVPAEIKFSAPVGEATRL